MDEKLWDEPSVLERTIKAGRGISSPFAGMIQDATMRLKDIPPNACLAYPMRDKEAVDRAANSFRWHMSRRQKSLFSLRKQKDPPTLYVGRGKGYEDGAS